jgi:DNA polymerase III sliding clamp (beta) subunit (PCNA family)
MRVDHAMLAVRHVASNDETRQNLNGIRIEGGVTVGTDGHMLATVQNVESQDTFTCQIGRESAEGLDKLIPKSSKRQTEVPSAELSKLGETDRLAVVIQGSPVKTELEQHQGEFPDWMQVVPQEEPTYRVAFNLDLLNDLAEIARACNERDPRQSHLVLEFFDKPAETIEKGTCSPIRVTAMDAPRFCGVLMPMRAPSRQ